MVPDDVADALVGDASDVEDMPVVDIAGVDDPILDAVASEESFVVVEAGVDEDSEGDGIGEEVNEVADGTGASVVMTEGLTSITE